MKISKGPDSEIVNQVHRQIASENSTTGMEISVKPASVQTNSSALEESEEQLTKKEEEQKSYLFYDTMARFGNNLFQYISSYCIALKTGHIPTIESNSKLLKVFDNINAVLVNASMANKYPELKEKGWGMYDLTLVKDVKNIRGPVKIHGFLQSYKYMYEHYPDIRQQLMFKDKLQQDAYASMVTLVRWHIEDSSGSAFKPDEKNQYLTFLKEGLLPQELTYVGVHVRRTDISVKANMSYFNVALSYYRERYSGKLLFMVCSDDITWCRENMKHHSDVILVSVYTRSPTLDFALLSSCNASIITGGTFSWWTAWLAGGPVIYFNGFARRESKMDGSRFHQNDYYPLNWTGMG